MTSQAKESQTLSALLHEERRFPPSEEYAAQANAKAALHDEAAADPEAFWEKQADTLLSWDTKWSQVLDWSGAPFAQWFVGGTLNTAVNCVDRHVDAGNGDKVAYYWEGEPEGDTRVITYADLQREVNKTANALTELGVSKGDRVAIYMPMIRDDHARPDRGQRDQRAHGGRLRRTSRRLRLQDGTPSQVWEVTT